MRVAVTGADGFLGWHLRVRASARHPELEVVPVAQADWPRLPELLAGVDTVIHLAGMNRGPQDEVRDTNIALARDVVAALGERGARLVFASSVQAGNGTPYGTGKAVAGEVLGEAA
ncbi:MAG: NAD-dependent epimerase/dehydratase family protein, partial [Actinomycetia bacterium]|nr:NAD-dependent epimerase/dehydratase family protein [Actinomycetes bacterium]